MEKMRPGSGRQLVHLLWEGPAKTWRAWRRRTHIAGRHPWLLFFCLVMAFVPSTVNGQAATTPAADVDNIDDEVVYIDMAGVIRVLDQTNAVTHVWEEVWHSPAGGWSDAALGDFTGEGDQEIVAIAGDGSASRLAIYDPVVASGNVDPDQQQNGVPWAVLSEIALPGTPRLIGTGNFDPDVLGDEIVYTYDAPGSVPGNRKTQVIILTQTNDPPDGRAWRALTGMTTRDLWSDLATGDLTASGVDNLVLIDEDASSLAVYHVANAALSLAFVDGSESRRWNDAAIGNIDGTTALPELALVRTVDDPLASLVVVRYVPVNDFKDVYLHHFTPSPRVVFLADVSGNGDDEMFVLRNVTRTTACTSPYTTAPLQLIMRNRDAEALSSFEVCLDTTNSFRYGAGGDLDGDGKDEVAVISANQLRVFNGPDVSTADVTNVGLLSNAHTIAIGNVDRNGSAKPDTLVAAPDRLDFSVEAGKQTGWASALLRNLTNPSTAIPIYVRVSPPVPWVHWSLDSASTPATVSAYVNAAELLPGGGYGTKLLIETSRTNVANAPLSIPVLVAVGNGLVIRPAITTLAPYPCPQAALQPQVSLEVLGSTGMTFTAQIRAHGLADATAAQPAAAEALEWPISGVPWIVSAQSLTTTVPATITLGIDLAQAANFNQADVVLRGDLNGVTYDRVATINLVCAPNVLYMPWLSR